VLDCQARLPTPCVCVCRVVINLADDEITAESLRGTYGPVVGVENWSRNRLLVGSRDQIAAACVKIGLEAWLCVDEAAWRGGGGASGGGPGGTRGGARQTGTERGRCSAVLAPPRRRRGRRLGARPSVSLTVSRSTPLILSILDRSPPPPPNHQRMRPAVVTTAVFSSPSPRDRRPAAATAVDGLPRPAARPAAPGRRRRRPSHRRRSNTVRILTAYDASAN